MNILPTQIFRQDYFGLSISQSAIRAISISSDKTIKSQAEVAITPQVFDHGVIDQDALVKALQELLAQGNFASSYAAISLPEYHSFTRTFQLPKMDLSEVTEALSWQLDQIFPLPKQSIYFDWKLVSKTKTHLNVVVVAVEKKTLDDLVTTFETANIKPISFEPAASALTRIITLPTDQPALLIDINPSGSSVSLIENNLSTLAITSNFQISQDPKVANQNINITSQAIQSLSNFYTDKHKQDKPAPLKLFLAGDSASQDLAKWLTTSLNHPVELLNLPNLEPKYHHAFAVAASTISPPNTGLSINLLPDRLQNLYKSQRDLSQISTRYNISLVVLLLAVLISAAGFGASMLQYNQTTKQLSQVETSSSNITYNSSLISSVNKASKTIVSLFPRKTTPINIINQIFQTTPDTIVLKNYIFTASERKIVITGVAIDRPTLIQYRQDLIDTGLFSRVNLPFGSLEQPENITFSIALTIKS